MNEDEYRIRAVIRRMLSEMTEQDPLTEANGIAVSDRLKKKLKPSILTRRSNGASGTLILIPGAGGDGKRDFSSLISNLGNVFTIYTARFSNEFDVRKYAGDIKNEIERNPNIKYFAIGGYSIGGAIAWHLAKNLKDSKKFKKKLFWIDSGIPNSTQGFVDNMVKINTEEKRYGIAQPLETFKKNRAGTLRDGEEKVIRTFYSQAALDGFKKENQGNYLEYTGTDFPPNSNAGLDADAEKLGKENPWVIEDKFDNVNFQIRYSVKPKEVKGKSFIEGDAIDYRKFAEKDTLKKKGLGRETKSGQTLPPLSSVQIISIVAGANKSGQKTKEELENKKAELSSATSLKGGGKMVVIPNVTHAEIVKSPDLAKVISSNY